jgi:hypothetical protein
VNPKVLDKALDKPKTLKRKGYQERRLYLVYKAEVAERLVAAVLGALGL